MVDQIASVVRILGITPEEKKIISDRLAGQIYALKAQLDELTVAHFALLGFAPDILPHQPAAPQLEAVEIKEDPSDELAGLMVPCKKSGTDIDINACLDGPCDTTEKDLCSLERIGKMRAEEEAERAKAESEKADAGDFDRHMIRCPSDSGHKKAGQVISRITCTRNCKTSHRCEAFNAPKPEDGSTQI